MEFRRILRTVSPALAERYLIAVGCELNPVDLASLTKRTLTERWMDAIQARPVSIDRIERDFADIEEFDDWLGDASLRETVRFEAPELFGDWSKGEGRRERALWALLERPDLLDRARRRLTYDRHRHSRTQCVRFHGAPAPGWQPDDATILALTDALMGEFDDSLRLGGKVFIEPILRASKAGGDRDYVQINIYSRGPSQTIEELEDDGPRARIIRPAAASIVAFFPESGTVEVVLQNGAFNLRRAIAATFGKVALGWADDVLKKMEEPTVTLDGLLARPTFDLGSEDGLVSVRIASLRLRHLAAAHGTIEIRLAKKQTNIWALVDGAVTDEYLAFATVDRAEIVVEVSPTDGRRRAPIHFDLAPPNRYTPRGGDDVLRMLIGKYLPRWGILRAPERGAE